jgi:hypothetical protein
LWRLINIYNIWQYFIQIQQVLIHYQ